MWTPVAGSHGNPLMMVVFVLLLFPKLALGLSGFETGVAVMPLVRGEAGDTDERPVGRIRNTNKLLDDRRPDHERRLVGSSVATTVLIPAEEFQHGGGAYGRALAYPGPRAPGLRLRHAYDSARWRSCGSPAPRRWSAC